MGNNAKRMREKMLREAAEMDRPENRTHPKKCLLPPEFIQKVRAAGLFIDEFPLFVSSHVATPSGYLAILPAETGGIRGYDVGIFYSDVDGNEAKTFMPGVTIWGDGTTWHTKVHEYAPGPGPGDFHHTHSSLEEAYSDLVSYFFDATDVNFQAIVKTSHIEI